MYQAEGILLSRAQAKGGPPPPTPMPPQRHAATHASGQEGEQRYPLPTPSSLTALWGSLTGEGLSTMDYESR